MRVLHRKQWKLFPGKEHGLIGIFHYELFGTMYPNLIHECSIGRELSFKSLFLASSFFIYCIRDQINLWEMEFIFVYVIFIFVLYLKNLSKIVHFAQLFIELHFKTWKRCFISNCRLTNWLESKTYCYGSRSWLYGVKLSSPLKFMKTKKWIFGKSKG